MGDIGAVRDDKVARSRRGEVTVLVTGFGPFLDKFPVNSSWVICYSLPEYLPETETCAGIRILKHPEPVHVGYEAVTDLVPKLLSNANPKPDIVLHMGLAAKFSHRRFAMERQSQHGVYGKERDVDGCVFPEEEDGNLWSKCPKFLKPTFDTDDVWRRWHGYLAEDEEIDARPSDDPGNFLCGFIYYSSMAWYWKRAQEGKEKERPIMFLHVPDLPEEEDIEVGKKVALALIRALVESREKLGVVDALDRSMDQGLEASMAAVGL
jgi:pyrrolidone-carboxylate peptidase